MLKEQLSNILLTCKPHWGYMDNLQITHRKAIQILNYHNFYISQIQFNFPFPHRLHVLATILHYKLPNTNMYITTLILPQGDVNIKSSPGFPILLKFHLFLLFSGLSFLLNLSLHAFNPYFVILYIRIGTLVASSCVACCRSLVLCTPCTYTLWQHMGTAQAHITHL